MVNDIKAKLEILVTESKAFQHESEVVYFLVQARKIIENGGLYSKYHTLMFYCNWVAHRLIDRPKTIQYIKRILEEMEHGNGYVGMSRLHKMSSLRSNLSEFLNDIKIPDFTQDSALWRSFFINLRKVLVEQPIEVGVSLGFKIASIEYIDDPDFEDGDIPLDITFHPDSNGHTRSVQYSSLID